MGRTSASFLAIAAVLSLTACGGGGGSPVASTPAPAPSPAPTPTPTPVPPPSTANADLIALTQSETFTNDAATGTANYPTSGAEGTATSSTATVSVVYDAATRSYTITNGARSQGFAQGDIDAATSNARITVFKKTSGTTTDTLTLTKPGTAGTLNYRWVGGGFWQRTVNGTNAITGDFDAFSYGVETLDGALVRTGGANYDVDLLGVVARPQNLFSLSGTGTLTVNFLSGAISGGSTANGLREVQSDTGQLSRQGEWQFAGAFSSTQNALTGTLTLYHNTTAPVGGGATGRFYGPNADEIGLAFRGSGADGTRSVGVLVGRKGSGTISGSNPSLTSLQFNETFLGTSNGRFFFSNPVTGVQVGDDTNRIYQGYRIAYRAATQGFAIQENGADVAVYAPANLVAAESNARYAVYELRNGTEVSKLALYKSGAGNDEFALTYAGFAKWQRSIAPFPTQAENRVAYLAFGVPTPNAAIPRTGTARYDGIVRGEGQAGAGSTLPLLNIEGTARFDFNFAAATFGGSMTMTGINPANAARFDLGNFTFSAGQLTSGSSFANQGFFFGNIDGGGLANIGNVGGYLMGPNAQELAATFRTTFITPGTTSFGGYAQGAIVAKKTP